MAGADHRRLVPLAVVGLVLVFGLPELGLPRLLFAGTPIGARIGRELTWIAFGALVLFWVVRIERLPLASIGLRRPGRSTLVWGFVAAVALLATMMVTFAMIAPALGLTQNMAATASIVQVPLWLLIVTPIVAGVTEEILYRGYAIERLTLLTGRRRLAGLIAGAGFLVAHWSWGGLQMIVVIFGTVILVGVYQWRRDLACCMLAHILADLIGFALARAQM